MPFNTNGTLMRDKKCREIIEAGLDEMRVSLDAAVPKAFRGCAGPDLFQRDSANVKNLVALKKEIKAEKPRLSLWLTGLRETLKQLPAFIRLAHQIGVHEVHLQRLVYFANSPIGLARAESSLFESADVIEGNIARSREACGRTRCAV